MKQMLISNGRLYDADRLLAENDELRAKVRGLEEDVRRLRREGDQRLTARLRLFEENRRDGVPLPERDRPSATWAEALARLQRKLTDRLNEMTPEDRRDGYAAAEVLDLAAARLAAARLAQVEAELDAQRKMLFGFLAQHVDALHPGNQITGALRGGRMEPLEEV